MTAIFIEKTLTTNHHLDIELPADFPEGPVRVTVETLASTQLKDDESLTGLGRKLLAIRRKAISKGLQLKSTDEILAEIRTDRGEQDNDTSVR